MESIIGNPTDVCLGDSTRSEYSSRGTITHLFETAPELLGSGDLSEKKLTSTSGGEDKPALWDTPPSEYKKVIEKLKLHIVIRDPPQPDVTAELLNIEPELESIIRFLKWYDSLADSNIISVENKGNYTTTTFQLLLQYNWFDRFKRTDYLFDESQEEFVVPWSTPPHPPLSSSTPPYVPTSPIELPRTTPPYSSATPTYNPTSPVYVPCSPSYVPSDELYKPLPTSLKRDREGVEINVPAKRMRTGDATVKVKDIPCLYENTKQGCLKGPYLCRFKHTRVGFRIDDKVVVVRGDMQGCEGFVVGVDSTGTYTIELSDICADELLVERGTELEFAGDTLGYPQNRWIIKEHVPTAEKQCRYEFIRGGCNNPTCYFKHTSKK